MRARRLVRAFVVCMVGQSVILSCSVDNRALVAGPSYAGFWIISGAPDAGQSNGGSGTGAGANGGGNVGTSGSGSAGASGGVQAGTAGSKSMPGLVDGCPDLDHNQKGDCKETLVENGYFATNTMSWHGNGDVFVQWSPQNHFDDTPSGSALLTVSGAVDMDGMTARAATQCVKVGASAQIEAFANAFIQSDQGEGNAVLGVFFFASEDCSGSPNGAPVEALGSQVDVWQTLSAKQPLPAGAKSALVRLAVAKPYRTETFKILFDNILIRLD